MNFVFVAIAGKVYKYDLVSKECLFEFNTYARKCMQLYDLDDKLIVADSGQIRLWDFFDHKEEIPELVTVLEFEIDRAIECVKVNKLAELVGEHKGVYYYIVSSKDTFNIYHERLELLMAGEIDDTTDKITCIEFGLESQSFFLGTEKGNILRFDLPSPQQVREEKRGRKDERGKDVKEEEPLKLVKKQTYRAEKKNKDNSDSIMHLFRVLGVLEQNFFIVHGKNSGLWVFDEGRQLANQEEQQKTLALAAGSGANEGVKPQTNKKPFRKVDCSLLKGGEKSGRIDGIKATPNGQFIAIGFPERSRVVLFSVEVENCHLEEMPTQIDIEFDHFETDECMTVMMFNNKKLRELKLYAV
jgi:hypothetical protein